jgi:hypothetical protein
MRLGVTDIDDMAFGIKALWNRPYFDRTRVVRRMYIGGDDFAVSRRGHGRVLVLARHGLA